MTLYQAMCSVLGEEIFRAIEKHNSYPEILKIAALTCFLHKKDEQVEKVIREGLLYLTTVGGMPDGWH